MVTFSTISFSTASKGSLPMSKPVDRSGPTFVDWLAASYVIVPQRDTTGMMPILHSLGLMMSRQSAPLWSLLRPFSGIDRRRCGDGRGNLFVLERERDRRRVADGWRCVCGCDRCGVMTDDTK